MTGFTPIAIVGRACVLPGALSPSQLWDLVANGRDAITQVPSGRWQRDPAQALCAPDQPDPDRSWSDRGGYVRGFEAIWDPTGFALSADALADLSPLAAWTLHCARAARAECRFDGSRRTGAVFGNLGFPSERMAAFAADIWRADASSIDPQHRYMSGGTADLLRQALALDAGSLCIDAACASALYAIKLACDRLQDGSADLMLAGAVQGADDLFLHVGFCALGALSRSGRSRPFHADADGLLPAEGAAFFALKRLRDARRDGDRIHGVIRGIGLSNDGRGKGLLAPSMEGQIRAMRAAYLSAGIEPHAISLLECHATGTPVGDGVEIASSATVFSEHRSLAVGSLKSNLGHLITAAGAAGLIKLLEAMRAGLLPPTLHVDAPHSALLGTPLRPISRIEPWPSDGPRIAAISAFGFGGNNAHLIVSEDDPNLADAPRHAAPSEPLVIVSLAVRAAAAADADALTHAILEGETLLDARGEGRMPHIDCDVDGLRFPPRDMAQALPQQLAMLAVAREALASLTLPSGERMGVFIGIEPDPNVARYGARWRLPASQAASRDGIVAPLESAGVLGCMPNIPANRLSSLFDFGGPAFTVQAGAASGVEALQIAAKALRRGELDAALVGAVDLSCEPVQRRAAPHPPGDAALALLLQRRGDAERMGNPILAVVEDAVVDTTAPADADRDVRPLVGDAHAASGLLQVAVATLHLQQRCNAQGVPQVSPQPISSEIHIAHCAPLRLLGARHRALPPRARLRCFAAEDKSGVVRALNDAREGLDGPARLVLVSTDSEFSDVRTRALAHLERGAPAGVGIHYADAPIGGELACVFAGAGAAYHGMGRALLQHLPKLLDRLRQRSERLPLALDWALAPDAHRPSALQQLWGASALSQLHLEFSQGLLGLQADAWLGYSSGETNALVASGVWTDPDALMTEMEASGLVTHELGGSFAAIERAWGKPVQWASWTVLAPLADVRAALADLAHVHIAIINSDADCLIAGDAEGCLRVVARIGPSRCLQLEYPLAVHVPELAAVAPAWLELHRRPTLPTRGRIYSNAWGRAYAPEREACARAILEQADRPLDLRPAVLAAWNDGVRVFVEHGPGSAYGRAIRSILGERPALVASLDGMGASGRSSGMEGTLNAVAALLAAGVPLQHEHFTRMPAATGKRIQRFAAHWPEVKWPSEALSTQPMPPAPRLPLGHSVASIPLVNDRRPGESRDPFSLLHAKSEWAPATKGATVVSGFDSGYQTQAQQSPPHPVRQRWQQQIAQLAQTQTQFVEQQHALHQRYLALHASATQLLLQTATRWPADMSTDEPPTPASKTLIEAPAESTTRHRGPQFDRAALEIHASGRIADLFGPAFAHQDHYRRQVRMPQPPLLLADRVLGLDAKPDSMGTGRIWTATDVAADSWYLHHGQMPAGVLIEAGQADLLLISWLGVDRFNRGERVYRLLGCELTYHGDLPSIGDTLEFEIVLDSHAAQGDVRLMFFHYDCMNGARRQLSVRKGQAGFFSDAELAESAGCLWSPEQQAINPTPNLDPPVVAHAPSTLGTAQLRALAAGDAFACFGAGFELAQTHTRTPAIAADRMRLLDRVTDLSLRGGPWGRGYLRAELDIDPAQWFFAGHFKNDPCMPGTLMFEGCLQAMALQLLAHGFGLTRDGWRLQPVPEQPYQLQCRGQVTPSSRLLVTEVFVEEVSAGPYPTLTADLLCTVDGLKAFHARRVALQLVPAWPLGSRAVADLQRRRPGASRDPFSLLPAESKWAPATKGATAEADPHACVVDGFRFDQHSLLACAMGRPSEAFGPIYRRFDGGQRVARLPSPPYLFMSRIREVHGPIGVMRAGARVVAEYDIPTDAWYFEQNGCPIMPFAVLLEAALQPCGWLSSYVGSALTEAEELGFRNLDGEGELLAEIFPDSGTLTTEVTLTDVSATGGMIIESFEVRCWLGAGEVYRLRTVFGFFPPAALANQAGLRTRQAHSELLQRPGLDQPVVLADAASSAARPKLAHGKLQTLDRIEGHWPQAGAAGLGQLRAVKDIDPSAWFFKAHFFQDPVQPGSLGLEAMLQALQYHMLAVGLDEGIETPRFEPIALARTHRWKYRGQVLPKHRQMHTTLEVTEISRDDRGVYALADASLWADGQRIYEMQGVGMRIVGGDQSAS